MSDVILEARGLTKRFRSQEEGRRFFTAVDGVSLRLFPGETLGLLGESGSGKSTLGQMLVGLIRPDEGTILYRGQTLPYPFKGIPRQKIQILFQHPEVSFNPQLTLHQSLSEPFRLRGKAATDEALTACIGRFGLYPEHLERRPGALSGGELQRAALARVLVMEPEVILLDEPPACWTSSPRLRSWISSGVIRKNTAPAISSSPTAPAWRSRSAIASCG